MFKSLCVATVRSSDSCACSYAMFQDTALPCTAVRRLMTKLWSPCRCQASDSNGKPGMLFGLKNPFRGLKFGNQASEDETTKAEQESQQQLAAEKAQPIGNGMPWRAWKQVLHLCSSCRSAQLLCLPYRQLKLKPLSLEPPASLVCACVTLIFSGSLHKTTRCMVRLSAYDSFSSGRTTKMAKLC